MINKLNLLVMKKIIYPSLLLLVFASCGNNRPGDKEKIKAMNVSLSPPAQANVGSADLAIDDQSVDLKKPAQSAGKAGEVSKKIIKEGDINFEAKDIKQT